MCDLNELESFVWGIKNSTTDQDVLWELADYVNLALHGRIIALSFKVWNSLSTSIKNYF